MGTLQLKESQKNVLNIVGVLVLVGVNTLINFFLSPFIVENLGVEANGYVGIANSFITYFSLITIAFNSMAGRFILISYHRNRIQEADEYYSSAYFANLVLAFLLAGGAALLVWHLPSIIEIEGVPTEDVRALFALTFANFFAGLLVPSWDCATYVTNNLYLRSLKGALTSTARAIAIFASFCLLVPKVQYVALGGLAATALNLAVSFQLKRALLPNVRVSRKCFRASKVRDLVSSGVWNSVTQCGGILLEGCDLLIANIGVGAAASGLISVSKVVPNMLSQIAGNVVTTFGPTVTRLYAAGDRDGIVATVKSDMRLMSVLLSLPAGAAFAYGADFFSLWVPTQDSGALWLLMALTLAGVFVSGVSKSITNIFSAINRLRTYSLAVVAFGVISVGIVLSLLRWTSLGMFAVVGASSFVTIARDLLFTAPYAAHCLGSSLSTFVPTLLRSLLALFISTGVGLLLNQIVPGSSWLGLILGMLLTMLFALLLEAFTMLDGSQRDRIKAFVRRV